MFSPGEGDEMRGKKMNRLDPRVGGVGGVCKRWATGGGGGGGGGENSRIGWRPNVGGSTGKGKKGGKKR